MKKLSTIQKRILCGLAAVLLLTAVVVSLPSNEYLQVSIDDQSMPLANFTQEEIDEITRLEEALREANEELTLAQQNEEQALQTLEAARTNVAATESGLAIAQTMQATAQAAADVATAAAAATPDDEALAQQAATAQTALQTANADLLSAEQVKADAETTLPIAQEAYESAVEETAAAQARVDEATTALEEAGGPLATSSSTLPENSSMPEEDTSTSQVEDNSNLEEDNSALEASTFSLLGSEEDEEEAVYQVVLNVLNNKLLRYDNAESTNTYIRDISTEYTTLTPELERDEEGNITAVTVSADAFAAAGVPEPAVGFSNFLGWSETMDVKDKTVLPANTAYSFDAAAATADEEGVLTFHLYAKYDDIVSTGTPTIMANGQTYQPLAYPASDLAATGNLPASVLYEPIDSEYLQTLDNESGSLYGHKDAAWENYEEGIGSIQFDFIMQPQTYDTDIVIVMDKSTSMNSGYINSGILNWTAAVQAVNNLAQGLMSDENSANNRVALVQFSGNTVNSFNFQNNWADFDSRFVETSPSGCHYFRDADGNIIQDYGDAPIGAVENPSGDGTNYTIALEQARVFADSRGETDRELVVLFVSDGRPEALAGYSNASNLTRAWTRDYNGITHHSVSIAASSDQTNPIVQAANGQSALASFSPTIYTIGIGVGSNADSLIALSTQTGGSHNSIGWAQENNIDSLSNIADTIFGDSELLTEMTDAIITDVITDEFALLIDDEHPVTLQRGNGEAITLTPAQGDTPDVNEYLVETIDYNGETREQIVVNMGNIDRELLRVKFFVKTSSADIALGSHPTNEEHTLTYNENDEPKSRNDLGEPELAIESDEPPFVLLPSVTPTTPDAPIDDPIDDPAEDPAEETPASEAPAPEADASSSLPQIPQDTAAPAATTPAETPAADAPAAPVAADFAVELPGGLVLELPEAFVPLAAALQDTSIDIGDAEIPLAGFGASWALLNLLLTVATALGSAALLIGYFVRKKNEEEQASEREETRNNEEDETPARLKRKGLARLLSIPVGVVSIIVFILTEDMTLPMTLMDEWTLLMFLIFAVQMVLTILSRKKFVKEDDEPKHAAS